MTSRILIGDVREQLATLPDASVQCCVTSPPYYGLRRYLPDGHPDQSLEIGSEPTLAEFIATLVDVFREVRRVLRPDGTCWVNMGDSYASDSKGTGGGTNKSNAGAFFESRKFNHGMKPKDLMMVPARLAIALCDDGWYLRSDIIWHKKAPMPESVTDRPTSAHEHMFLLTKQPRYFYDAAAVAEPVADANAQRTTAHYNTAERYGANNGGNGGLDGLAARMRDGTHSTRNLRNVWTLGPESFSAAHFATFPTEIPRRCIKAGTSERGCCPACGASWARVTKRVDKGWDGSKYGERVVAVNTQTGGTAKSTLGSSNGKLTGSQETVGWEATCACFGRWEEVVEPNPLYKDDPSAEWVSETITRRVYVPDPAHPPVPSTILDPFLGSGTTLLVADQLGRHGIGIELKPEYAALARKRIVGDAPLFARVAD